MEQNQTIQFSIKWNTYSIDTEKQQILCIKNNFVADKTFLVLHKIFSFGVSLDITVINKANLRSYST